MYTAIEVLAEAVGDKETAKVAKGIRREEERMASFLEKQIPILTREVVKEEIPRAERGTASSRKPATGKRSTASSSNGGRASKPPRRRSLPRRSGDGGRAKKG